MTIEVLMPLTWHGKQKKMRIKVSRARPEVSTGEKIDLEGFRIFSRFEQNVHIRARRPDCARLRLSCPICFKAGPGRGPCGSAVGGQAQWQQPTTNARLIYDRN